MLISLHTEHGRKVAETVYHGEFQGRNAERIDFAPIRHACTITHAMVDGKRVNLSNALAIPANDDGITPMFDPGMLAVG